MHSLQRLRSPRMFSCPCFDLRSIKGDFHSGVFDTAHWWYRARSHVSRATSLNHTISQHHVNSILARKQALGLGDLPHIALPRICSQYLQPANESDLESPERDIPSQPADIPTRISQTANPTTNTNLLLGEIPGCHTVCSLCSAAKTVTMGRDRIELSALLDSFPMLVMWHRNR